MKLKWDVAFFYHLSYTVCIHSNYERMWPSKVSVYLCWAGLTCSALQCKGKGEKEMITCYFQYSYSVISSPTQFLQLSPRFQVLFLWVVVFFFYYLFVCFWNFNIPLPHCLPSPTFESKRKKKAACVPCWMVCQGSNSTESSWRKRKLGQQCLGLTSSCWCRRCFPSCWC